jgi:hypothetical protein
VRSSGATRRTSGRTSTASSRSSRACRSGSTRRRERCRAASSRCARSAARIFVERIFEIIREINEQGTTILLVEQNALMALDAANRGYVLETGTVALADDAKTLRENDDVRRAYLGES